MPPKRTPSPQPSRVRSAESEAEVPDRSLEERLEEAEAELRWLAGHDPLTGLANRSQLDARLRSAVARARKRERAVALLFVDLDNFKLVNDSFGHVAGDRLLRRVATRLGGVEEPGGLLARHGGDEFLVLLDDLEPAAAEPAARAAADDIAVRLAKPFQIAGAEFHVEASVGISLFPGDADGAHTLLQHADTAMYQSKGRGRAASTVYARDEPRPARAALAVLAAAARDRRRRARAALPADRVDGQRAPALDGGAAALERPRARARAPRRASSRPPSR